MADSLYCMSTGSITSLQFPSRTHLITASEDSTITLFRSRDWTVLRSFKGHVGRVNSVAVHPTGKLALSLGKDRTLKVWDLMKGKAGGSTKLGKGTSSHPSPFLLHPLMTFPDVDRPICL
jgi:WD40 repeat protein